MKLPEVNRRRFEAICKEQELSYQIDPDGDLSLGWENAVIYIGVEDERFKIFGMWRGRIETDQDYNAALDLVTEFNSNRFMPKAYLMAGDAGQTLICEVNFLCDLGMSEEQLEEVFAGAIGSIMQTIADFDEAFPHLVTWSTEEEE